MVIYIPLRKVCRERRIEIYPKRALETLSSAIKINIQLLNSAGKALFVNFIGTLCVNVLIKDLPISAHDVHARIINGCVVSY